MGITKKEIDNQQIERLGEVNYNKAGDKMTIIEYKGVRNIIVQFENGMTKHSAYQNFKKGTIINPKELPKNRLYRINYNKSGEKMTIIEYNNSKNIVVQFDDGNKVKTRYDVFCNGQIKNPKPIVGKTNINFFGNEMTIIKYNNANDITIQFSDGYICKNSYNNFKKGVVKNPYDKSVYNVGFIGEGKYKVCKNNKITLQYKAWNHILENCYSKKLHQRQPTYKDCTVCKEWHNFQNFGKWYDENFYEIKEKVIELNKDILHKGNKIYNPDNCIFVPRNINKLFLICQKKESNYPIGVGWTDRYNKYTAHYSNGKGKSYYLGTFNDINDAFNFYKKYKENLIKEIANDYKNKYPQFPQKVYNAIINYQVEITD